MPEKVLYFGYGANSQQEMMEAITGNSNLIGYPATLEGYKLCVQRLDQVPNTIAPDSPAPISPRELLKKSWPDTFESYVIKPGSEDDSVAGTVWELTLLERKLIRDWELIDYGWYKDKKVIVRTEDGREIEAETEDLREGQEVDREVSGRNYEPLLNPIEDFRRIAEGARKGFFERLEGQQDTSIEQKN